MEGETDGPGHASPMPAATPPRVLRWPWLLGAALIAAASFGLLYGTLDQVVQFGSGDDEDYTSWVVRPLSASYALTVVVAIPVFVVLCFQRWSLRTRAGIVASLAAFAIISGLLGFGESHARRDIRPQLVAAVAAVHIPAGLTPTEPTQLSTDGGDRLLDLLPVPEAERLFRPAVLSGAAACAELRLIANGQSGWVTTGCSPRYLAETGKTLPPGANGGSMQRAHGRVLIIVGFDGPYGEGGYVIRVDAEPNDGY